MTKSPTPAPKGGSKTTGRKTRAPEEASSTTAADAPPRRAAPPKTKTPTKGDLLVTLLRDPGGVTAAKMAEATGWQIHSVRGFIAGSVKKKLGLKVATEKVDGQTVYRVVDEAAA
jgi:hypothetical protein